RSWHRVPEDGRDQGENSDGDLLTVLANLDEVPKLRGNNGWGRSKAADREFIDDHLVGGAAGALQQALPRGAGLQGHGGVEGRGVRSSVCSCSGFGERGDL